MAEEQFNKTATFIDAVDKELHDYILRLDQKLKGFLTEIYVKIEMIDTDDLTLKEQRKEPLILLSEDVKKAIEGIKTLVNLALAEGISNSQFAEMNRDNIESLRSAFKDSLDKVIKMREEL